MYNTFLVKRFRTSQFCYLDKDRNSYYMILKFLKWINNSATLGKIKTFKLKQDISSWENISYIQLRENLTWNVSCSNKSLIVVLYMKSIYLFYMNIFFYPISDQMCCCLISNIVSVEGGPKHSLATLKCNSEMSYQTNKGS